ncbi:(-)-germacrene D synthase [Fagus crenata]
MEQGADTDDKSMQQVQELKEEVKRMLMAPTEKPLEKLDLIDKIQRLGVSYHFESEINEILQKMHNNPPECNNGDSDEHLYTIALWFRLLRQQGYNVSCASFIKGEGSHICEVNVRIIVK